MILRKPMGGNLAIAIADEDGLCAFARCFARHVSAGDAIAMTGPLGAGKTTFGKALGQALGVEDAMTSPTFTLVNRYETKRWTLFHGDLYRLSEAEIPMVLDDVEVAVARDPNTIALMEWADRAPADYAGWWTWHLHLIPLSDSPTGREITVTATRDGALAALRTDWEASV